LIEPWASEEEAPPDARVPGPRARVRAFLRWLLLLRGSPRAIAGGVAVGMLVAFSPTIGFQTLIALGLATLLGLNRPAAIVPTWLTNPVTIPPVYAFTYYLGSFVWEGPKLETVTRALRVAGHELAALDFLSLRDQLDVFLRLGIDVFVPMWIGGLLVGGLAAALSYPITLRAVVTLRRRRAAAAERRQREQAGGPDAA